jgi:hypothetical protein
VGGDSSGPTHDLADAAKADGEQPV